MSGVERKLENLREEKAARTPGAVSAYFSTELSTGEFSRAYPLPIIQTEPVNATNPGFPHA